MSGRATAILGISGAAALGIWIKVRRKRRASSGRLERHTSGYRGNLRRLSSIDIDDDTAAEIIKRARPELERARALY